MPNFKQYNNLASLLLIGISDKSIVKYSEEERKAVTAVWELIPTMTINIAHFNKKEMRNAPMKLNNTTTNTPLLVIATLYKQLACTVCSDLLIHYYKPLTLQDLVELYTYIYTLNHFLLFFPSKVTKRICILGLDIMYDRLQSQQSQKQL